MTFTNIAQAFAHPNKSEVNILSLHTWDIPQKLQPYFKLTELASTFPALVFLRCPEFEHPTMTAEVCAQLPKLSKLKGLSLEMNQTLLEDNLLSEVAGCLLLEELILFGTQEDDLNPLADNLKLILGCKKLKKLEFSFFNLETVDFLEHFEQLPMLESLSFHNCRLSKLPENLQACTQLKYLSFSLCRLKNPEVPASYAQLSGLLEISLSIGLTDYPLHLAHLPKLRGLNLLNNPIQTTKFPQAFLLCAPQLYRLHLPAEAPHTGYDFRVLEDCLNFFRKNLSLSERPAFVATFLNQADTVDRLPLKTLLGLLVCPVEQIARYAFDSLYRRAQGFVFEKNSFLSIRSLQGLEKEELQMRLANAQVKHSFGVKISPKTTHVLVGIKTDLSKIPNIETYQLLTAQNLTDYLNKAENVFLLDESQALEQSVENLSQLLNVYNPIEENILLACQLLKAGGVPKELYTRLLILVIGKLVQGDLLKSLKKLLSGYLPTSLRALLPKTSLLAKTYIPRVDTVTKHFEQIVKAGEGVIDRVFLGEYFMRLYENTPQILHFIWQTMSANEQLKMLHLADNLNLERYQAHRSFLVDDFNPDKNHRYEFLEFAAQVPIYSYTHHYFNLPENEPFFWEHLSACADNLEYLALFLNSEQNKKLTLPKHLLRFSQLKVLDLGHYKPHTLPAWLADMPNLETIILDSFRYAEAENPDQMPKIPKLQPVFDWQYSNSGTHKTASAYLAYFSGWHLQRIR